MSFSDSEMHVVAGVGACIVTLALGIPTVLFPAMDSGPAEKDVSADKVVINASLAMRKTPKKQPQKQFRQPDAPDKPLGVSKDDKKVVENQCCTDEADCTKANLPVGTTCADDATCTNHRCVKKRDKKNPDDKDDKVAAIPDRTKNLDDPKGNPTDNTVGEFDGSKKGTARSSSGDPWFRELVNDFMTFLDFPKIEIASAAEVCLQILADGTIKDLSLTPPNGRRSDNDGLNGKIDSAYKKLQEQRKQKPSAVPTHLLKQVVTKWICIPIDAQTKQD
jgi:hypothetical protein